MKNYSTWINVDKMVIREVTDALLISYKNGDTWESNHVCIVTSRGIIEESIHRRGKKNQVQTTAVFDHRNELQRDYHYHDYDKNFNYIYGGLINYHFGHFLSECVHRIWGFHQIDNPKKLIFVDNQCKDNIDIDEDYIFTEWQAKIFQLMGVDLSNIIIINRNTYFPKIIVPSQASTLGPTTIASNKYVKSLPSLSKWKNQEVSNKYKLFVSRSKLRPYLGIIVGQKYLEQLYEKKGFKIVHPQELSLEEQIHYYANSSEIVFVEGSSIHILEIFSNISKSTNVLILSRGGFPHKQLLSIKSILEPRVSNYIIQSQLIRLPIALTGINDQNETVPAYRQSGSWSPLSHYQIYTPPRKNILIIYDQIQYIQSCFVDLVRHYKDLSKKLKVNKKVKEISLLIAFAVQIIYYIGVDTIKIFKSK